MLSYAILFLMLYCVTRHFHTLPRYAAAAATPIPALLPCFRCRHAYDAIAIRRLAAYDAATLPP